MKRRFRRRAPLKRHNRRVDRERVARRRRAAMRATRLALVALAAGFVGYHGIRMADSNGWLDLFRVREVRVVGAEVANPGVLVAEAGLMGEELHYWSVLDPYVARVRRDPFVASARFHRRFPRGLTLEITERRPVALLALDRLTPVDSTGTVLPVDPFHAGWDAPVVEVRNEDARQGAVHEGRVRHEAVAGTVAWLTEVGRRYPALEREISSIEIGDAGGLILHLVHNGAEVLLERDTPMEKLAYLDDVLRDLEEKGVSFSRLDLRFADQIVVRRG